MTDDEAFVRAIVASPADDAPRLVYADWLEERGDLRGVYLRATVTWSRRLRQVETQEKAERQLRHVARSLDPVWVARVTAPPVGICCDRVRIQDCGAPVSADRIDRVESRLGIRLPAAYRALLLNYNGGIPQPDVCYLGHYSFSRVQAFYSLGERMTDSSGRTSDDGLETHAMRVNGPAGPFALFPIAAVVESRSAKEDFEEEDRRSAHSWSSASLETCLALQLESSAVISVHVDLAAPARSRQHPFWLQPIARSLSALLAQLDELPENWEPED